jgi:hypothetical protein
LALLNINLLLIKKCCIINAFGGTEYNILWDHSDLDCPDLRGYLEGVDLECETGRKREEDSE